MKKISFFLILLSIGFLCANAQTRCRSFEKNGTQCRNYATSGSEYCSAHNIKKDAPGSGIWYNNEKFVESFAFESDEKKYNMVYTTLKSNNKEITDVYFIPEDYDKDVKGNMYPPRFEKLVYHNLGKVEDNFAGVWTSDETFLEGIRLILRQEIRLPDDIAGKLIDMLAGDYKMPPNKYLKENCIEEVFDANLKPSHVEEDQMFY